jgi:hypothetical protein
MQAYLSVARLGSPARYQWLDDGGVYGAISRDLPALITTSTYTPAPHNHFPSWESLLPQASRAYATLSATLQLSMSTIFFSSSS